MLWNLHILEKPCHPREDDIYARILILLKIYVELRLVTM